MLLNRYKFKKYTIYMVIMFHITTIYCIRESPTLSAISRKTLYIVVVAFLFSIYGSICYNFIRIYVTFIPFCY